MVHKELGKTGFLIQLEVGQTYYTHDRNKGAESIELLSIGADRVGLKNLKTGKEFDADTDRLARMGKIGRSRIDMIVPAFVNQQLIGR